MRVANIDISNGHKQVDTRHIIPNKPIHLRVLDRVVGVDYRYLAVSVQTVRNAYWHRDQAKSGSSPLFVHLRSTSDRHRLLPLLLLMKINTKHGQHLKSPNK